ncbi:MAG: hypothetical protein NT080_10025 [Spirochaetes bacterium]|nr:hypothetical protein [Spirochaetota bacterium]
MPVMKFPGTEFAVGDPEAIPLLPGKLPSPAETRAALDRCIVSASGWRTVFAGDGGGDSLDPEPSPANRFLAGCMALAFSEFLVSRSGRAPVVALGVDTRPTGPAIAGIMARVFLGTGVRVRYPFMIAAPEIMAWTRACALLPAGAAERIDGFCLVTASHNPPGHNGVKFGLGSGGVLAAADALPLAARFRELALDPATRELLPGILEKAGAERLGRLYAGCLREKRLAYSAYLLFSREVASGTDDLTKQEEFFESLSADVARAAGARAGCAFGVVAEMNGSARSLSVDVDFLESLGVTVKAVNAVPGTFAHRIVPEGSSLDLCRVELEKARAQDPGFVLGYVPDCDGDRGNIVAWDDRLGRALPLEAQETFALAVLAELGDLHRSGVIGGLHGAKAAVVCNDATSLRIDRIASTFGVEVRRSETGEANVVSLASALRDEGYLVRIMGEGSNGGNITHPEAVRDPLATIAAVIKLLSTRDDGSKRGIFRSWLGLLGRDGDYRDDFTLADVVATLPAARTTGAFEERAALRIGTVDPAALKRAFQRVFTREWPSLRGELMARTGADRFDAMATNGTQERRGLVDLGEAGGGGLKLQFSRPDGSPVAFMWLRGSGTEPVLRVVVDVCLDPSARVVVDVCLGSEAGVGRPDAAGIERFLHERLVAMVLEADAMDAKAL